MPRRTHALSPVDQRPADDEERRVVPAGPIGGLRFAAVLPERNEPLAGCGRTALRLHLPAVQARHLLAAGGAGHLL
ncbi:hypothetical protein G6F56_014621 [Rhizopus delemar]|nr:hypothetical protein G6F56_014621 [Rhizopus delemar]